MAPRSSLCAGVKALLTCDSGTVVSGIVDFVVAENRLLRILSAAMQRISWLATLIIVLNGLRCFLGVSLAGRGDAIVVARRPNERRAVDELKTIAVRHRFAELVIGWRPGAMMRAAAALMESPIADLRRTVRFARRLRRRYGVFHALRVVELVAYYRRYSELLIGCWFRLAVMSSHSNPHGIALNLVARRFDVPVVLVTHGMPILPLARLDYDVAIHECAASARVYREAGCRMDHVVIKSRRRDHAPMQRAASGQRFTVGIFLSKDPAEERVLECMRALLGDAAIEAIVVRPHPVNLWRRLHRSVAAIGDPRVRVQSNGPLTRDLRQCDVIVGGNSTILLDAVVAGRPGCYVRGLDHGPYDVQRFVANGLVPEWHPARSPDFAAVARFYQRDEWPDVLRRFADVDRDDQSVASDIRAAIGAVTATGIRAVA